MFRRRSLVGIGLALFLGVLVADCSPPSQPDAASQEADVSASAQSVADQATINEAIQTDFPAKVKDQWLPQIRELSTAEPQSIDEVWQREGFFDLMATNLDGDRLTDDRGNPKPDTPEMAAARKSLRAAIAAKQIKVFPVLRRAFVKLSADKMWENNVDVTGSGRRIIYTAAFFADNGSVKAAEEASAAELQKLRFSRAEYAWYKGGRAWSYDLKTPSDGAVGVWPSVSFGDFEPVK